MFCTYIEGGNFVKSVITCSIYFFNLNYAIPCSAFTINNGCANVRQWLRQAYSPPNGDIAFSPTLRIGLNYLALSGLFFNG